MQVTGKRILVKQRLTEQVSKGGIVMAGDQQPLPYGEILGAGPECPDQFCIGDVVLFSEIGAIPLGHMKKNCVLIEPDDVLAILEEGDLQC